MLTAGCSNHRYSHAKGCRSYVPVVSVHIKANEDSSCLTFWVRGAVRRVLLNPMVMRRFGLSHRLSSRCGSVGRGIVPAAARNKQPSAPDRDQNAPRCGGATREFRRWVDHSESLSWLPPSNSKGVTSAGTKRPSMVFTRRMCPNLFALARCSQFHVTKKSHL